VGYSCERCAPHDDTSQIAPLTRSSAWPAVDVAARLRASPTFAGADSGRGGAPPLAAEIGQHAISIRSVRDNHKVSLVDHLPRPAWAGRVGCIVQVCPGRQAYRILMNCSFHSQKPTFSPHSPDEVAILSAPAPIEG
jgi:hypothetical protein